MKHTIHTGLHHVHICVQGLFSRSIGPSGLQGSGASGGGLHQRGASISAAAENVASKFAKVGIQAIDCCRACQLRSIASHLTWPCHTHMALHGVALPVVQCHQQSSSQAVTNLLVTAI
jgi:hypothetical protein